MPAGESCNGQDDNCDGQIDEGLLPPSPSCAVTNAAGTCQAAWLCLGAAGWVCPAQTPAPELCNGKDDDCQGGVDEDYRSLSGVYVHDGHCGACGLSCGDIIAHGSSVCEENEGSARCVVGECDAGYYPAGPLTCLPESLGLCDPCVSDTECIGSGARCLAIDGATHCANRCDSAGGCPAGYACDPGLGNLPLCLPITGSCTCDGSVLGLQRSCKVDSASGVGSCLGLAKCGPAGWSDCQLPAESCNLLDDDCDGLTDEGFVTTDGRYIADESCGACGNDCTLLTFAGGGGSCNSFVDPPVCSLTCGANCTDLNANPSDGCECCDPVPLDEPDPAGFDANCDSIDGELNNAIFVAKAGDDGDPGTRFAPKRTIQAGIDAAAAQGKRDVYVSTGVYGESVLLAAGVAVYGGYGADFSRRDTQKHETAVLGPNTTPERPGAVNALDLAGPAPTVFDGFTVFGASVKTLGSSSYAIYVRNSGSSLRLSHNLVVAGSGGKGKRGVDGTDGPDGSAGSPGQNAFDVLVTAGVEDHDCAAQNHSPGGVGGSGSCGGASNYGGDGGLRACPKMSGETTRTPLPEEAGHTGGGGGGLGGAAGRDVYHQAFSCLGFATFGPVEGLAGIDGNPGVDGPSGSGCGDADGSVVGGLWIPVTGGLGGSGAYGSGGGGGGSGGGAFVHQSCYSKGFGGDNLGGTGGGGGAGACGGTGGSPGTGGGGAFGIFIVFTTPSSSLPVVQANALLGGTGGDGGDGGNAGTGGSAGAGAFGGGGGGDFDPPNPTYPAYEGGKGGNGGNGGNGGGAGGGCGGAAVGIFLHGAAPGAPYEIQNTFVTLGDGGEGGHGGFSLGEGGGDGSQGSGAAVNF